MMTKIVTLTLFFVSLNAFATSQPHDALELFNADRIVARELKKFQATLSGSPLVITVTRAAEGCAEEETYLVVQQITAHANYLSASQVSALVTFSREFATTNNGDICDENTRTTNSSNVKVVNLPRALFVTEDLGQSKN